MVKMKEQHKEIFFVQVKEPNEVRKHILETLRHIVEVLHRFEKFKQIRHEKIEKIHKLRSLVKETDKMLGTLKSRLPQTNLRATVVRETPHAKRPSRSKERKAKPEQKQEKAPKKEMTEMEKLEAELSAIEGKLKGLA